MWSKKWYLKRNISCDANLLNELLETDVEDYINYLRMNKQAFNMLVTKVLPYVQKRNTRLREALSPKRRITLQ
jgi:predicted AlkP superfamily phosphohydrolase/phosphomutase